MLINPIEISIGKVPFEITNPLIIQEFGSQNEHEHLFYIPQIAHFYIVDGKSITIEPLTEQWDEILIAVYYNCLLVAIMQRNLLAFHVSGVFVGKNEVFLFAAPSGTGKSTTASILQTKGYAPFTDDSALVTIENNVCYAQASYPEMRLRENTVNYLNILEKETYTEQANYPNKYCFNFDKEFSTRREKIVGIAFLDIAENQVKIEKMPPKISFNYWGTNIYLNYCHGMKKSHLLFQTISSLAHHVPAYKATRPLDTDSFDSFAEGIITQIIKPITSH
jgi:hypothetical protein